MRKSLIRRGFTMLELSLSIAFIAILSIAIVLIITNAVSSYHRGLTLGQVNSTGMELVDDMRASIQNSSTRSRSATKECASVYNDNNEISKCEEDKAYKFITVERRATVEVNGNRISDDDSVPVFGAFCTGTYSYIWNSGYFFNQSDYNVVNANEASLTYRATSTESSDDTIIKTITNFKLLKIQDDARAVCISAVKGANGQGGSYPKNIQQGFVINGGSSTFDISSYDAIDEDPVQILTGNGLAIYNLDVSLPAESSLGNNVFYTASFILGTVQGGINIKSSGDFCATPKGYNASVSNFDYCAINKFSFAAQVVGGAV